MARPATPPVLRTITQKSWCAIRRTADSGKEWIPTSSVGAIMDEARRLAAEDDRHCGPDWARLNPVIGIRPVTLTTEL